MTKYLEKYNQLGHAIQSAIAACIGAGWRAAEPKHLRVGIDTSKSDQGALARLLIKKGIFTDDEYGEEMVRGLEAELESFKALYRELTDSDVDVDFH